ncbi:hypothetical protein [Microbulbifer sp. VAAF005]|uniref:hypothetical protein n=1 Tax=Microbulbifer sp. VAAF005 TaxID=3034230 RepID=UPI0024AE35EA|nr:hypothetical protein [Microbulbifer sp. VAAF005]WHI47300.1 hypothetical protein P0078_02665 [Microbulbifer sp. VAAF005]
MKINNFRLIICIWLLFQLSGCITPVKPIVDGQNNSLDLDEGFLLVAIDTNFNLDKIKIKGAKHFFLSRENLHSGSNYILFKAPAGEYRFDKIFLGYAFSYDLDEEYWSFQINPGVISYVGHLAVDQSLFQFRARIELENRSTEALEFLEESFPELIKIKNIQYAGPGKDDFFEIVAQTQGE